MARYDDTTDATEELPVSIDEFDLDPPVFRSFRLFTDGEHPEIDAMAICAEALDELDDPSAAGRAAHWLALRFGGYNL